MTIEINGIGTPKQVQTKMADAQLTRSHATESHAAMVTRSRNYVILAEIAVNTTPIPEKKTSCTAYQATCWGCDKLNHLEAVCRSRRKGKSRNKRCPTMNKVSVDESTDEGEKYTFSLSTKTLRVNPSSKSRCITCQ